MLSPVRQLSASLRRRPGFVALVVLTLGVGIGLNTVIFSVIHALLWRSLPFPEPETLVMPVMVERDKGIERGQVSYPDVLDWRSQKDVFEQVALIDLGSYDLMADGRPEKLAGAEVSVDYFPLVRARTVIGRALQQSDFEPGAEPVVVLARGLWQRLYAARSDVLGESLRLSDVRHTIVGVLAEESAVPSEVQLWVPLDLGYPLPHYVQRRDNYFLRALARLQPGVTVADAEARLRAMARQIAIEMPERRANVDVMLITLNEFYVGAAARVALGLVFGTVFLVLVVACFNIANLLLARAVDRRREIAVRLALGAGRGHLLRQLLGESLLLAILSGTVGVLLATLGVGVLRARAPSDLPGLVNLDINAPVLLFAIGLSGLTAFLFGQLPAWQLRNTRLGNAMPDLGAGSGRGSTRLRSWIVAIELTVSIVLLVLAGLLARNLDEIVGRHGGVDTENRLTLTVDLPAARYPDKAQVDAFFDRLLERLAETPGVRQTAASSTLPIGGRGTGLSRVHLREGAPEPPAGPEYQAYWNVITPEYFRTMSIPLLRGRAFTARDDVDANPVVIINETMAKAMFPGGDPLGQRIRSWRDEDELREIVGIVGSVRYWGMGDRWQPMVYVPNSQAVWPPISRLVVHTAGDPGLMVGSVRGVVWSLDESLPVTQIDTMAAIASRSIDSRRYVTWAVGALSPLALLLAVIGLYGIVAYSVAQRTREIGLRMALGAGRGSILRLFVSQGFRLCLVGAGTGLTLALVISHLLADRLAISPRDPLALLGVAAVLVIATLLACLGPARRATRVDPLEALRYE